MKIAKKLLSIFLAVLMLITVVPVTENGWFENMEAEAAGVYIETNNGNNFVQYVDPIYVSVTGGTSSNSWLYMYRTSDTSNEQWCSVTTNFGSKQGVAKWRSIMTAGAATNGNAYKQNTSVYDTSNYYLEPGSYCFYILTGSSSWSSQLGSFTVYGLPKPGKSTYACTESVTFTASQGMYTSAGVFLDGPGSSDHHKTIGGQNKSLNFGQLTPGSYVYHFCKTSSTSSNTEKIGTFTVTGHNYNQKNTASTYLKSAATHSSAAVYYYSCTCGAKGTTTFTSGNPVAHTYNQKNTASTYLKSAATCTSPAVYYYSCSCGVKGTSTFESGSALGHKDDDKDHVCDRGCGVAQGTYADGNNDHKCDYCGEAITTCADNNKDHNCDICGTALTTCADNDPKDHNCDLCGAKLSDHEWDEGVVNPDPTCTKDGVKTYTCSVCGETKTEAVTAKGHTPAEAVKENIVPAKCTTDGSYDEVVYCSVCDAELSRTEKTITAPGHDYADTTYSWSDDGKTCTATRVCKRAEGEGTCGHTETADATVEGVETKAPSCTEKGETTYTATFNVSWAETKTKTVDDIAALDHDWDTVTYDFAEDGSACTATRVCKRVFGETPCGATETAVAEISKEEKTPATCKDKGWTTYTATFSETWAETKSLDVEDIPAKGHDFAKEFTVDVKATCEADGSKSKHCSRCEAKAEVTPIEKRAHVFEDAENGVITPATCLTDGVMKTECVNEETDTHAACDAESTRVIPANGHDFNDVVPADAANCIAKGNIAYKTCKACNLYFGEDAGDKAKDGKAVIDSFITEIDGTNHENTKEHTKQDSTCEAIGYTEGVFCDDCQKWISGHEVIPAKGHTWEADGEFTKYDTPNGDYIGKYIYECTVDGCNGILEIEVKAADYSELEDVKKELEDLLNTDKLTDEAKAKIEKSLDDVKNFDKDLTKEATNEEEDVTTPDGQSKVDTFVDGLEDVVTDIENGIADETYVYVDLSIYKAVLETYNNVTKAIAKSADQEAVQDAIDSLAGINEKTLKKNGQDKIDAAVEVIKNINATYAGCAKGEHNWDDGVVTNPTCTAGGYTTFTCEICGGSKTEAPTTALGHLDADTNHICDRGCGKTDMGEHADSATDNDHVCDYGCKAVLEECLDADNDHACDNGCDKYFGTHEDKDPVDHKCDYGCDATFGTHEDTDSDHNCDYGCSDKIGEHADGDKDHKCDYCKDGSFGTHEDTDSDHNCDYGCSDKIGTHADNDPKDHKCDYCGAEEFGKHEDSADDEDHICDYCKSSDVLEDCSDVTGDGNHSCDVCGKADITAHTYGEWVLTTAPTAEEDGEYTKTCSECNDTETKAVKLADYKALEDIIKELEELKKKNLTDEAAEAVKNALDKANNVPENLPADVKDGEDVVIPGKQNVIDDAVGELTTDLNNIKDSVADGTALKADYTSLNEAIAALEAAKNTAGLTDEAKARLENALVAANGVDKKLTQSETDKKIIADAAEAANNAAVLTDADYKVDKSAFNTAVDTFNSLGEIVSAADKEAVEKFDSEIKAIPDGGSKAQYQNDIDTATKAVTEIIAKYSNCSAGNHKDDDKNHACDYGCTVVIGTCEDKDKDHDCDYGCTATFGEHKDSADDEDHICDYCKSEEILEACSDKTGDKNHKCDICGKDNITKHTYSSVVTEPTCTADGYTTHTCTECGDSYTDTPVTAPGHTPAEAVTENFNDSTCYAEGSYDEVVYCSVEKCGEKLSSTPKTVTKKAHTPAEAVTENFKDSTCYAEGSYDEVVYCSVCKEAGKTEELSRTPKTIEKKAHTPGAVTVENTVSATCTEDGSYENVVYCTVEACKAQISREKVVVDALGHTDGEAVIENNEKPDCENKGSYDTVTYCTVCKEETSRKTTVVDALGHDEVKHAAKAATCTEIGWDAYVTCTRCDYTTYNKIDALGHTEVTDKAVDPTCTETGLTEGKHCSVCDEVLVKQETVKALGHKEVKVKGKAATCTETGLTDGVRCSVCKEMLVEQKLIEMLDHNIVDVPSKAPTCSSFGLTAGKKCSYCGKVTMAQQQIAKLPHTEKTIPGKAATCSQKGLTEGKQCTVCNEITVKQEVIEKLPHNYKVVVTDATCEADGYKTRTCSVCLASEVVEVYKATGHNFVNGKCTNCNSNNIHNCSHLCHKTGFIGFIWKIINFLNRLFNLQQYCDCGMLHYEKPIIAWPW